MAGLEQAAVAFGLALPDAVVAQQVEVWAELWPVVRLFDTLSSQWRTGPGGAVGLDYGALPPGWRPGQGGRRGQQRLQWLQVMEAEALERFADRRTSG